MRILRHGDYRRMSWKNGLGVTEEVIAYPPQSDMASFGWRVSIAHVGADGPFSLFPGVDRTIALLDGEGIALDLPDRTIELDRRSPPFAFSGDCRISSRNRSGPTVDLNVMTRRGLFRHEMRRISDGRRFRSGGGARALIVSNGFTAISGPGGRFELERFDAAVLEGDQEIAPETISDIFLIRLFEISPTQV